MGLLYKSEKRAIFKVVVLTFLALALLGASIQYWYVSLPVLGLLVGLVLWARIRQRNAYSRAREAMTFAPENVPAPADRQRVPVVPASARSTVDELAALADMRSKGVLSQAEFEAAKRRMLAEPAPRPLADG